MHESYIVAGLIDGSVVLKQAHRRLKEDKEETYIHYHQFGDKCNDRCYVYKMVGVSAPTGDPT